MKKSNQNQLIKQEIEQQREDIKKFGLRKAFSMLYQKVFKPMGAEARTYQIWKPYFKMAGKKLKREDCRKIRENMIKVADKLYEFDKQNLAENDAEFERREK